MNIPSITFDSPCSNTAASNFKEIPPKLVLKENLLWRIYREDCSEKLLFSFLTAI